VRGRKRGHEEAAHPMRDRETTTPSGHRVKVVLTLFLPHDVAEYLTPRARSGRGRTSPAWWPKSLGPKVGAAKKGEEPWSSDRVS
jgi:hypothetical protein